MSAPPPAETRQTLDLLARLGDEARRMGERIEAAPDDHGTGDLLQDVERLQAIVAALDAIARDPVA